LKKHQFEQITQPKSPKSKVKWRWGGGKNLKLVHYS